LIVVLSAAVHAVLPPATMMTSVIAPDGDLIFHPTMLRLTSAASSRTKTFLTTSTASFKALCIWFRWALTRTVFAKELVSAEDLAIDDAKEAAWMALYEHNRDTLDDIIYRRLHDLWAPITDPMKVFDTHGPSQQLCAQKVWEALLASFPLDHKRMQTVLLAREIARMMRWDGDSKGDVNRHFASITETWRTMGYISTLSIEDVLKSVLMATLKAPTNRSLRDAYHKAWMTSTTTKTCLSLSSKTPAPANF
jgi:hypothetical protein